MYGHQPVSMLKRISAAFLDFVLLITLAVGCLCALQAITGYDEKSGRAADILNETAVKYGLVESSEGIDTSVLSEEDLKRYDVTKTDYSALSEEQQLKYKECAEEINSNSEYNGLMRDCETLIITNVSLALFLAFLLLEFGLPLLLGNGMTAGKKIFGICVIRCDCVRISPAMLFVRSLLGKYTFETMVPVLIIIMIYLGYAGSFGLLFLLIFFLIQFILLCFTPKKQPLHDLLACTCTADYGSQRIFADNAARQAALSAETDNIG